MKNVLLKSLKCTLLLILTLCLHAKVVSSPSESIRIPDHVPVQACRTASFVDRLEGSTSVPITFVLPLRNPEELAKLIEQIYDPTDPEHYGKYLTTAEFIERFAPTQENYEKVIAHAASLGLKVNVTHPNRILLNASGEAQLIESAFNLNLHHYLSPDGRHFHAPNNDPEVPLHVASLIHGIIGLDNYARCKPYYHQKKMASQSQDASREFPSGPGGGFGPSDLLKAYNLLGVPANGSNQIIALFELATYQASDIEAYTQYFGLPPAKLKDILVDGGSHEKIDAEVTLDIQLALALAPESEIYVYEGPNSNQGVLDTYNRIATDNLAKQVSTSWGLGENLVNIQYLQAENAIFQQMAAQGQTIYAAAGDSGAFDDYPESGSRKLIVDDPASQPYVVGVGGTRLTVNATTGAYQMESVWNDGLGNGAGGGGVSRVWPIPAWQANVSTASSLTHRNVPDVALNADTETGYAIFYDGQWQIYGGTSCAAPLWAAFTACVNQSLSEAQKPSLGFANPRLYAIATGTSYQSDFHDVTMGNNLHYFAHAGYDNASGWGSFNGNNLYAALTGSTATPFLRMILKHNAPFAQGEIGTYRIVISNAGTGPTSAPVIVALSLPNELTYHSFSGAGWTFNEDTLTFTQTHPLSPGSSYPTIVLNLNIAKDAHSTVIPEATVSGGGCKDHTAQDLTTIR